MSNDTKPPITSWTSFFIENTAVPEVEYQASTGTVVFTLQKGMFDRLYFMKATPEVIQRVIDGLENAKKQLIEATKS